MSQQLGVSFPTISKFINELLDDRLIREDRLGESTGGRKPVRYALNGSAYCSYGAAIGRKLIQIALIDLDACVIESINHEMRTHTKPEEAVSKIHESIQSLESRHRSSRGRVMGLGVAANGPLDRKNGIILDPVHYPAGWSNVPVVEMLKRETNLPILFENQARAAALAEQWYGAARNLDNLAYILVGTGIGVGLVTNGSLIMSEVDITGALGNMVIRFDRALGNRNEGKLEDYASIYAICQRVESAVKEGRKSLVAEYTRGACVNLEFRHVLRAYREGDALCREVMAEAAKAFGVALANFITFTRPGKVILGGEIIEGCNDFLHLAVDTAEAYIFPKSKNRIEFVHSALGQHSFVVGAATLVFNHFLD
jgi:predicted NBD/HSP70 family sugar kinase